MIEDIKGDHNMTKMSTMMAQANRAVVDRKANQVSNYLKELYLDKEDSQATSFAFLWMVWHNLTIRLQDMIAEGNGIIAVFDAVLRERGKCLASTEITDLPKH